jgi:subtilisin family serine protease
MFASSFPLPVLQGVSAGISASSTGTTTRYIARYNQNNTGAVDDVRSAGATVVANFPEINTMIVDSDNPNFSNDVLASPNINLAVKDMTVNWLSDPAPTASDVRQFSTPDAGAQGSPFNAAFLPFQWNLARTQTIQAWSITQGSPTVKVAVLDTGIDAFHQDLVGKIDFDKSASFINEPAGCGPAAAPTCFDCQPWQDRQFHGTHVGAIISSNNLGTASVAPNVRLRAIKVLNCTGSGSFSGVINGIIFAANTGNDVINMSLGFTGSTLLLEDPGFVQLVQVLQSAITYAQKEKGVLVVSSAGNEGLFMDGPLTKALSIPAQLGGVNVGSTTIADLKSNFSNFGLTGATMMAPGGGTPVGTFPQTNFNVFVLSACNSRSAALPPSFCPGTNFYLFVTGTSQAAPQVSGAAALIASRLGTPPRGSYLAPIAIRNALLKGASDLGTKGVDPIFSGGRLNTFRSLQ